MPDIDTQSITPIIDHLVTIAPWAGGALVVAIVFRIMDEKPSSLISALGKLLWGRNNEKRPPK